MKTANLPVITYPYTAELSFFKHIDNQAGKLTKTPFEGNSISSPFYFLLEIKDIENNGQVKVMIYDSKDYKVDQRVFSYGEAGMYYEYIIFYDRVESLPPDKYRAVIFCADKLIYETPFTIGE